ASVPSRHTGARSGHATGTPWQRRIIDRDVAGCDDLASPAREVVSGNVPWRQPSTAASGRGHDTENTTGGRGRKYEETHDAPGDGSPSHESGLLDVSPHL